MWWWLWWWRFFVAVRESREPRRKAFFFARCDYVCDRRRCGGSRGFATPLTGGGGGGMVRGPLADLENDELGGLDQCDADEADEAALVDVVLGHGGAVAANEEGVFGLGAQQCAVDPFGVEEVGDGGAECGPERLAVGFEEGPLGAFLDGGFEVDDGAADVDVCPFGIVGDGSGAPDADAAGGEGADGVDAGGVEEGLGFGGDGNGEAGGGLNGFVGGGVGDAEGEIVACEDAGDEAAGGKGKGAGGCGVVDGWPGIIEGGEGGIEDGSAREHLVDGVVVAGIQDGEAVARGFGVGDECVGDGCSHVGLNVHDGRGGAGCGDGGDGIIDCFEGDETGGGAGARRGGRCVVVRCGEARVVGDADDVEATAALGEEGSGGLPEVCGDGYASDIQGAAIAIECGEFGKAGEGWRWDADGSMVSEPEKCGGGGVEAADGGRGWEGVPGYRRAEGCPGA